MLRNLRRYLTEFYSDRIYSLAQKAGSTAYFTNFKDSDLPTLSRDEQQLISRKWCKIIKNHEIGFHAYRVFKMYGGFDVNYVPESYAYPYILRSLNPTQDYQSLTHKGMIDIIFSDLPRPKTIARKIGGGNLSINNDICRHRDLLDVIAEYDKPLIIKPAKDSSCGRGVSIIQPDSSIEDIRKSLNDYEDDYVIQEFVAQSEFTEKFNPSSLNTFRVTTLFINNRISKCYVFFKAPDKGRVVDNLSDGGLLIGVDEDGNLRDVGYNNKGIAYKEHNGIELRGKNVPNFEGIIKLAFEAHRRIATCGFVGWDIALDKNNSPVLIEANLWWPSFSYGQVCNGPCFGDRTDEVIEFVRKHPAKTLTFTQKV